MEVYNMNPSAIYAGLKAEITAEVNKLMPKSGGTFTGNVIATSTNRKGICVRNIGVSDGSSYFETDRIIMQRK